jgi:DeoR/GlpR family transcriptional regulator of sugar metabolism
MSDDVKALNLRLSLRQARIVERLQNEPVVDVASLSAEFGVSSVTIRSDLDALDRQNLIRRVRGGAMAVRPARFERPNLIADHGFDDRKARIGVMAARMVRSGETIILDAGTTSMAMASALHEDLTDVLVVTSSLEIALIVHQHPGLSVIITGGKLKKSGLNVGSHALVSPFGTLLLERINADAAFVCCSGIHADRGFTNAHLEEIEIKRAMIASARRIVMLGDSGKIGHVAGAQIATLPEVTTLISDVDAKSADIAALEAAGLQVILV